MTLDDFADILESVTFRDWRFKLGNDVVLVEGRRDPAHSRPWLQIEFEAGCSILGTPAVQRGRKWFLSPHMTRSEIVQTALVAVLAAVEHEAREDFRYRGEAIFGPHFDCDALFAMAASSDAQDVRA